MDSRSEIVTRDVGPTMGSGDERTRTFIDLMLAGRFFPGKTIPQYAKAWGLTHAHAGQYATAAARFVRLIRDPEAVRATVMQRLHEIGAEDKGDRVPALLGAAKLAGVLDRPLPTLTREERVARTVEALSDPDDELSEALLLARKAIWKFLFGKKTDG